MWISIHLSFLTDLKQDKTVLSHFQVTDLCTPSSFHSLAIYKITTVHPALQKLNPFTLSRYVPTVLATRPLLECNQFAA